MRKKRLGKLTPRYLFALNPYTDARFSKCPKCSKLMYPRKFPLLIHVDGFGLFIMGKTCRYCSKCELIIAHQDELDPILVAMFEKKKPEVIGNEYLVMGTVDRNVWKEGLREPGSLETVLNNTADFKKHVEVTYEPGGWGPRDSADA